MIDCWKHCLSHDTRRHEDARWSSNSQIFWQNPLRQLPLLWTMIDFLSNITLHSINSGGDAQRWSYSHTAWWTCQVRALSHAPINCVIINVVYCILSMFCNVITCMDEPLMHPPIPQTQGRRRWSYTLHWWTCQVRAGSHAPINCVTQSLATSDVTQSCFQFPSPNNPHNPSLIEWKQTTGWLCSVKIEVHFRASHTLKKRKLSGLFQSWASNQDAFHQI